MDNKNDNQVYEVPLPNDHEKIKVDSKAEHGFKHEAQSFKRIMRRTMVLRIFKSALLGLAIALPLLGILFMLNRFEISTLKPLWNSLICVGAFAFVSAGAFFALLQTKKSIAMRLDKEHKLSEKVQTMLAFSSKEGPILDLQRQDASKAIASVKNSVIGIKRLWIYVIAFILGLAVCIVSFFFNPIPEPPAPPPPETPFAVTELQLTAISDLIDYVNASEMQEPYKAKTALALTALYNEIQEAETITQRDETIQKAMDEIYLQTDQSSGAVELMNALWRTNAQAARQLAKALNYYDWPKAKEWERFTEQITDFRQSFVHEGATAEDADEALIVEETKNILLTLGTGILSSLENAQMDSQDALYIVLVRLASAKEENADGTRVYGMQTLAEYIVENDYTKAQRELDATVTALSSEIYRALSQHKTNTDTGEYAMTTIANIFTVLAPEFKRPELHDSTSGSTGDGDGEGTGGGISGGPTYGSDDKVYDPFTNRYVEYGKIIDKYYSIMFSKLQGGSYTDEEQKALEEYFKILYGGFGDTNENE